MKIEFNQPKEIVIVEEVKRTTNEINIISYIDYPERKIVKVVTSELGEIILWEGEAYDIIGQWTDTDVINKLRELYGE